MTLFVVVLVLVLSGYFWFQRYRLYNLSEQKKISIQTKQETLSSKSSGLEFNQFVNASQSLEKAEKYRIKWSEIVRTVLAYEKENITFERFSVTPQGTLSVQGKSTSLNEVVGLLETLKKDTHRIKQPFISSLRREADDQGQSGFTFQLTFNLSSL